MLQNDTSVPQPPSVSDVDWMILQLLFRPTLNELQTGHNSIESWSKPWSYCWEMNVTVENWSFREGLTRGSRVYGFGVSIFCGFIMACAMSTRSSEWTAICSVFRGPRATREGFASLFCLRRHRCSSASGESRWARFWNGKAGGMLRKVRGSYALRA